MVKTNQTAKFHFVRQSQRLGCKNISRSVQIIIISQIAKNYLVILRYHFLWYQKTKVTFLKVS